MAAHLSLSDGQDTQSLKKCAREESPQSDQDAELIFVGMEHVNKDAEILFVRVISNSKPVISNILNRVTPGSCPKRKKDHCSQELSPWSQPAKRMIPSAKVMAVPPVFRSEWKSIDEPILVESSSQSATKMKSPQAGPPNSSSSLSPSPLHMGGATHSAGGSVETSCDSKRLSTSDTNSRSSRRSKLNAETSGEPSSAMAPSGICPTLYTNASSNTGEPSSAMAPSGICPTLYTNVSSNTICLSGSLQNGTSPFPWTSATEKASMLLRDPEPVNSFEGLAKTGFLNVASQNKASESPKRTLVLSLSDLYYGKQEGDGQPEQKTHTTFKCPSCPKVLKNVKFINHMKHHLELERQRGDSWESHTTCQRCHRQFPTPFQLQGHIDSVHMKQEPSAICKICELSFETDQILLQHMKDNHKPGEMPYVCQVCSYRSAVFADVETHFRTCHENTKNLICLFCLKIFKMATAYMNHCWGHVRKKRMFPCSKCRLQFLTSKDAIEHQTENHQIFKKPEPLQGLPPDTEVVIHTSAHPSEGTFITVSNSDPCLSAAKVKKRKTRNAGKPGHPCSQNSG